MSSSLIRRQRPPLTSWAVHVCREADKQVRLRGEVHRLIAPRDQKYQSNFVEVSFLWLFRHSGKRVRKS